MKAKRKKRVYFIVGLLFFVGLAVSLALYALRQNIDLYFTPTQLLQQKNRQHIVRLGGVVVKNSVHHVGRGLQVAFSLTDFHHQVSVYYRGILPSLFRQGQGIVAEGRLNDRGVFIADQVLAKHDEHYKPPGIH